MANKATQLRNEIRERYEARKDLTKIMEDYVKSPTAKPLVTKELEDAMQRFIEQQTAYTDQLMETTTKPKKGKSRGPNNVDSGGTRNRGSSSSDK